jgi:ATP-binding protein involved in chromosome partitioning
MRDKRSYPFEVVRKRLDQIRDVILVGSGKGGVGKSMIASAIAISLSKQGRKTGLFDVDLHGASVPNYLSLRPPLRSGKDGLEPKNLGGLKAMSIAFFAGDNPVPIRGIEKEGLIAHLMALTNWGELDHLIVDLPPGTGDEVLSAFSLFAGKCRLLLVTTPSKYAFNVVSLMCRLAEREKVPLTGVVLNMSYMLSGGRRIYPMGRTDFNRLKNVIGAKIIAEVPLEPMMNEQPFQVVLGKNSQLTKAIKGLTRELSGV